MKVETKVIKSRLGLLNLIPINIAMVKPQCKHEGTVEDFFLPLLQKLD